MNKNQSPAVVYYKILELREQIKKQIAELNRSLKELTVLNARVDEGTIEVKRIVDELMVKQIELDVLYKKIQRDMIEEETSQSE